MSPRPTKTKKTTKYLLVGIMWLSMRPYKGVSLSLKVLKFAGNAPSMTKWPTMLASMKGIILGNQHCQSLIEFHTSTCLLLVPAGAAPSASSALLPSLLPSAANSRSCGAILHAKMPKPTGMQATMYQNKACTGKPYETSDMPRTLIIAKAAGKPMMAQDFVNGPIGVITFRKVHSKIPKLNPMRPKEKKTQPNHVLPSVYTKSGGIVQPNMIPHMAM
mmetsp:Transcript_84697/g.213573  ORF Transcript_84697/g.213573 Transcript_84697/m.213573 type:complete len:218 (+) Transcript_84697:473-1126(+)